MGRLKVTPSVLLLGLATALVFVSTGGAHVVAAADAKEEMTISPTDKHYSVNPGEVINDSFTIVNSGQVPYNFTTYSAPYSIKDTAYNADTSKTGGRADAFQWIQFTQSTWSAGVRDTVNIPFSIKVSRYASPGGHYAVIFAEEKPTSQASATGVTRNIRMGMVVYINVKGNATLSGAVSHFDLNWYQSAAPLSGSAQIRNDGQTDFPVTASFVVSDVFGHQKYAQQITDTYVLPGAPRDLSFGWKDAPWLGIYKVQMGAEVLGKSSVHESYVIIAPRWLLFIIGLVILLGVIRAVQSISSRRSIHRR